MLCGTFRCVGGDPVQNDTPELPEYILNELPNLPRHGDRKTLAPIITKLVFPVSHRSLEVWPLKWRFVNGRALAATDEALAHAWRKFKSAPVTMSGRRRSRALRSGQRVETNRETAP
jgi:hypothetical protein